MTEKAQQESPAPPIAVPPLQDTPFDPILTTETPGTGGTAIIDKPPFDGEDEEI